MSRFSNKQEKAKLFATNISMVKLYGRIYTKGRMSLRSWLWESKQHSQQHSTLGSQYTVDFNLKCVIDKIRVVFETKNALFHRAKLVLASKTKFSRSPRQIWPLHCCPLLRKFSLGHTLCATSLSFSLSGHAEDNRWPSKGIFDIRVYTLLCT